MKRACEPLPLKDYSHHMAEFDGHYAIAVQLIANTDLASRRVALLRLQAAQVHMAMMVAAVQLYVQRLERDDAKFLRANDDGVTYPEEV